jgi:hypothetical protein
MVCNIGRFRLPLEISKHGVGDEFEAVEAPQPAAHFSPLFSLALLGEGGVLGFRRGCEQANELDSARQVLHVASLLEGNAELGPLNSVEVVVFRFPYWPLCEHTLCLMVTFDDCLGTRAISASFCVWPATFCQAWVR